jgi:hypothetical protein
MLWHVYVYYCMSCGGREGGGPVEPCVRSRACMHAPHAPLCVVGSVVVCLLVLRRQPGMSAPCGACPMQQCERAGTHALVLRTPCFRHIVSLCACQRRVLLACCRPACMHDRFQLVWHMGWFGCPLCRVASCAVVLTAEQCPAVLCPPHLHSDAPAV